MTVKIAIIGSGPSGIYAMDGASKYIENCQIDIIDRLPTPYGLVRAGVAPDHLGTKNVTNQYEKAISKADVQYFGNIEIGQSITIEDLKDLYDAIIIATGAFIDRDLNIPGENLKGVYGSAQIVGWYNGHPDFATLAPNLSGKSAIIIGNGNVSLDISRLLVKTPEERSDTDIHKIAADILNRSNFEDVYIVGRRGPLQTSFTPPELRELGKLEKAYPVIDKNLLSDSEIDVTTPSGRILKKAQDIFKGFAEMDPSEKPTKAHLLFLASPIEIIGHKAVEAVRFERNKLENGKAVGTGDFFEIAADVVLKAIGYKSNPLAGVPFDEKQGRFLNIDGHITDNLYVVGWGKRGPSGTIPTNRPDSFAVAKLIAESVNKSEKNGRTGLQKLIKEKALQATSFDDWKKIDLAEVENAIAQKPREKFIDIKSMLDKIE